jgi:phospholipid transport system substrate-binding protein
MRALYREHFDQQGIAAAVMGRAWAEATAAQRAEFLRALETYVARSYTTQLSEYAGERLVVVGSNAERDGIAVVSQIARKGGPLNVSWKLRKAGDGFKIRDVVIENVSLTLSLRRELATSGGSPEGIVQAMRQLAENPR